MNVSVRLLSMLGAVAIVASACAAPMVKEASPTDAMMIDATPTASAKQNAPATEAMMRETSPTDAVMKDTPEIDSMSSKQTGTPEAVMDAEAPSWFAASLTDVNTGQTFTIGDHKGKVVLVEAMAVWCSNCLRQQRELKTLKEQLGPSDDFVSIALAIDPNEAADILKGHTAKHGFDWKYAVSPSEVSRELAALYGNQFLNPPSVPMLVIDRRGGVHVLPFGVKDAAKLSEMLQPFLAEAM